MELYLVRHGEAMSENEHPERPLTPRGREEVARVSAAVARFGVRPAHVRHSGKRRALETAELLAAACGLRDRVVAVGGMAPMDDVGPVADELCGAVEPLMLVGHLPFLSRLASLLLARDSDHPLIHFRSGAIVCLTREQAGAYPQWSLSWMLTPEIACG